MAKKKKKLNFYSTDPEMEWFDDEDNEVDTLPSQQQKLRVMRDRKQRKGKEVTLVTGFVGTEEDLKDLGKTLKSKCGVGGSTKDNEIILQGNWVEKVVDLLKNMGYSQTKRVGG
ncbi:translation initiation factor [Aureispira sp. CCB-E]|uniref:translation initiation factor n=1 Tax=Aureispira sp. CCB-E TaxID=3051121 RepID=UPI002868BB75|nr:translation initiation factor [Aureispira sp. CCB-E]WMX14061.1 translation initiation factor [Aureispira sp. CCB-E]